MFGFFTILCLRKLCCIWMHVTRGGAWWSQRHALYWQYGPLSDSSSIETPQTWPSYAFLVWKVYPHWTSHILVHKKGGEHSNSLRCFLFFPWIHLKSWIWLLMILNPECQDIPDYSWSHRNVDGTRVNDQRMAEHGWIVGMFHIWWTESLLQST